MYGNVDFISGCNEGTAIHRDRKPPVANLIVLVTSKTAEK